MTFWLLAITIAIVASAALSYAAAGRMVNAGAGAAGDGHFRLQLREIEADVAAGKMAVAEALSAKAELAREVVRQRRDDSPAITRPLPRFALPVAIVASLVIGFATYAMLGNPDLPAQPFAARPVAAAADNMTVDQAIKMVEARLASNPDDLRGWQVIAPVYMQAGRFADAEHAFRQILKLSPPTADSETDLAEALMEQNGGQVSGEVGDLLHKAAALDPKAIRPRFYLAAEAMRDKDYASAVQQWQAIIALGKSSDNWMPTAQAGLAAAQAGAAGKPLPPPPDMASAPIAPAPTAAGAAPVQQPDIIKMVSGLADRLARQGGSLAEWTQLVRSEIVLGDMGKAQSAYDAAKKAYPDGGERAELDALAAQAGLKLDGGGS
jgi:cytochrome c-type biogenesis protein CcmH